MIKEVIAKSLLRKYKKVDSWFLAAYGMNIYRGCHHNCTYCDGRSEGYCIDGEFGKDIQVKINAPELLNRELDPTRKRKPMRKGYIVTGGGVGDAYQPVEKKYGLSRKILEIIKHYKHPVHILTKSSLIVRDIDIIKEINNQNRAIVSFSFSSMDDAIGEIMEPGLPSPVERLEAISTLKKEGITCGIYFMPIIPLVTDTTEQIEKVYSKSREVGVDFMTYGAMTLKPGKQKDHFLHALKQYKPGIESDYKNIYLNNQWGGAKNEYYQVLNKRILEINKKYKIPLRIPPIIYNDILDENDYISVILEQIDNLLNLRGEKSPYGYAAWNISQLPKPLSSYRNNLKSIKGVGNVTEKLILEILNTGTCRYLLKLLS